MSGRFVRLAFVALAPAFALVGCSNIGLDPAPPIIHARFDPDAKVIPMPTDVLRDAATQRLDLPVDDEDISAAEREFYTFLETLDGWSTAMSATVEFTGPINTATVTSESLQVWKWSGVPARVADVNVTISADEKKITIDPPRAGWDRGSTRKNRRRWWCAQNRWRYFS